jgi:DDB1- and CUL4-associated factor 8
MLSPGVKRRKLSADRSEDESGSIIDPWRDDNSELEELEEDVSHTDSEFEESEDDEGDSMDAYGSIPVIYPRRRFVGARNVDTVKDGS